MMQLFKTVTPIPGRTYAIHPYSDKEHASGNGADVAVTVEGSNVCIRLWEGTTFQKWECVEKNGWLGFICRASTASPTGAYLGFNVYEVLVCTAQNQDKWEDFSVVLHDDGCAWQMRKDDHLAYVGMVNANELKMLRDRTTKWGFTEWV
ncbi:uncharacterized protein EDB93DRAFT_454054 [Suillus bovinus]|uniref:uncharacterized protein n=1 Tax=Suillus bovinus TaxID=48563 RepID=UPI001B87068F|nr:uncharacterized protein EDB93DRAFT_454054 [Suillus bovinus]KAG2146878.1 hypothetical protein EDB93DRAFT_454054 [Suillus bovinus]